MGLIEGLVNVAAMAAPELVLHPGNVDKYLNVDIEPIKVDYSQLDIKNKVDVKSFMRICEARGFKLVHQVKRPNRHTDGKFTYGYILYNHKTKDYIRADTAEEDNVCYGGVSMNLHRVDNGDARTFHWNCSTGGHRGQAGFYCEFTQHDGLFRHWEESKEFIPKDFDFDWSKIGFDHYGVPVPVYVELKLVHSSIAADKLGGEAFSDMHDMGEYYFTHALNGLLCLYDESLKNTASPHYSLYEDWYYGYGAIDQVGWFAGMNYQAAHILNAVYTYLKVPQEILDKVIAGARTYFGDRDNRNNEQLKKQGGVAWRMNKSHELKDFDECAKALKTPYKYIDRIVSTYGLPELKDLPVRLPWV